ncbi:hypothetical protein F4777DRAFT_2515 [Nemania sp. FL0916]|nr:hypothetical protein F4777DRAFT_2515 [Nemania sp. FL0916]
MAGHGASRTRSHRTPLGDTTDQVVNASPAKLVKSAKSQHHEMNPLGAHPVSGVSSKPTRRKGNALISSTAAPATEGHANSHVPAARYTIFPGHSEAQVDNRFSQISTSSGASSSNRKTHIGPWQLGKTLGKGSAARVRLARHETTHDVVAVKILAKNATQLCVAGSMAELDRWDRTRREFNAQRHIPLSIEREVAVLKLIDHPHIVKLHDIWENRAEIYLVLEYMDAGDLFSYIAAHGPLPEFETIGYFRQILTALEYVHSFNICHRDLKPENILMKSNGVVKIADFGMAAIQQSPTHALRTSCGSPHYAAPELINGTGYQGDKVDVWSLGVLLYVALCRNHPFNDEDMLKLLAKAQRGVYSVPDFLSRDARSLIAKMLTVDPARRISTQKIWQHRLVQKYADLDDLGSGNNGLKSRASDKSKPVAPGELDVQILRQLKSIWHTFSEKQITMQLCNAQPNDQKLFYWLLLSYREQKLENYDMDLTYSPSDFHHLQPASWKKKVTTAEFPSRNGRTPSRFTVISNVPTSASLEEADVTDGNITLRSYDPYKASRVIEYTRASHAKIVVHRNGSTAKNSTHSSNLRHGVNTSLRSTSTRSGQRRSNHRMAAPSAIRGSRQSLSSIQSGESAPYVRPASRRRRCVNFSRVRRQSGVQQQISPSSADITGENAAHDPRYLSPDYRAANSEPANINRAGRAGSQSMGNVSGSDQNTPHWNDEVREFSHSIARDCDDAFNSPFIETESYLCDSPNAALLSPSTGISVLTPTRNPWDRRPLPPTPPISSSVMHEISMAQKGSRERYSNSEAYVDNNRGIPGTSAPTAEDEAQRRIVSAPIYAQYSTQWGRDKVPLPPVREKPREGDQTSVHDKLRAASAPERYAQMVQAQRDERDDFEFLCRQENTIRIVNSPSAKPYGQTAIPDAGHGYGRMSRASKACPHGQQELDLRQQYAMGEPANRLSDVREDSSEEFKTATVVKKKSLWFKRGSKDKEDVTSDQRHPAHTRDERNISISTASSADPAASRKKSFNLAFWRNNKSQVEMSMAADEHNLENTSKPIPARTSSREVVQGVRNSSKGRDPATPRNIEPQQNWLARLFRVKPATRYICFAISRRRARQETATLLKEWRQYGMQDIEVDKERNIVFARLGPKNYANLKEVAFAAELMTVIEHGRHGRLCIARFTQERGAASSFHRVVGTMESMFRRRDLLVAEKRRAKMMIKTLNS